jgi:hypothetical protein
MVYLSYRDDELQSEQRKKIWPFRLHEIQECSYGRVTFKKTDQGWIGQEGAQSPWQPLDTSYVETFLTDLLQYEIEKMISIPDHELPQFGFHKDSPESLQINHLKLFLGLPLPYGYGYYFRLSPAPPGELYIGSAHLALLLNKPLADFL